MSLLAFASVVREDPSAWTKRLPVAALALFGCAIATYLSLFQLGLLPDVWEPFFGNGSRLILKQSAIARWMPIPDAALGALAYLIEAVAECTGGRQRWQIWPDAVLATGLVLVGCQVLWFGAYCTLCLASAACSLLIIGLVTPEVRAAWRYRRHSS